MNTTASVSVAVQVGERYRMNEAYHTIEVDAGDIEVVEIHKYKNLEDAPWDFAQDFLEGIPHGQAKAMMEPTYPWVEFHYIIDGEHDLGDHEILPIHIFIALATKEY